MPNFAIALGVKILAGVGLTLGGTAVALAIGAATIGFVSYNAYRSLKLRDPGEGGGGMARQQLLVRSTIEPRKIVYGQAVVSGPLVFMNAAGTDNFQLVTIIAVAGREIDSFQGYWLDDKFIPIADVNTGGDYSVNADTNSHGFGPVGGRNVLYIKGYTGTSTQTADATTDSLFTEWTSNHRGRGIAYMRLIMERLAGAEAAWDKGPPNNISALVKGHKVYDPRLDSTFVGETYGAGSGAHRLNDPATWAWSANPALCVADYMIDQVVGAKFDSARIDYDSAAVAADQCDVNVAVPVATTQDRFTCNGVLSCGDTHRDNLEKLLSSMAGTMRYYNGQFHVAAGMWPSASSFTLNETHLVGPITYRAAPERTERYNAVRGQYLDANRGYKVSPYLPVEDPTLQANRDDGLTLWKELELSMVTNEYLAQRIAFRALEQASRSGVLVFPTGYNGLNIAPGDRGTVSIAELGWSSKTFRCIGLKHVDLVGVELVLKEDDSLAYSDPIEGDYGTRTSAGVIDYPGIPLPTIGVVVDGHFSLALEVAWLTVAGAGASISSGGGEGGANALVLTNNASVTQDVKNGRKFPTDPADVVFAVVRAKKNSDVSSIVVRASYYRSDTLASLGNVDVDVTPFMLTNDTYYTIPVRLWTPTTYTLDDGVRILGELHLRMVPDGSGTATATFSSIVANRFGTVGTPEIDVAAATIHYAAFDSSQNVNNIA